MDWAASLSIFRRRSLLSLAAVAALYSSSSSSATAKPAGVAIAATAAQRGRTATMCVGLRARRPRAGGRGGQCLGAGRRLEGCCGEQLRKARVGASAQRCARVLNVQHSLEASVCRPWALLLSPRLLPCWFCGLVCPGLFWRPVIHQHQLPPRPSTPARCVCMPLPALSAPTHSRIPQRQRLLQQSIGSHLAPSVCARCTCKNPSSWRTGVNNHDDDAPTHKPDSTGHSASDAPSATPLLSPALRPAHPDRGSLLTSSASDLVQLWY